MRQWTRLGAAWALSAALALAAGCGDDDKDSNGTGPSGEGTPVTTDNAAQVQAALTTTVGTVAAKGPGTHDGAVSGQVTIAVGAGKRAQTGVSLSMAFDNYSDDGALYLDGELSYAVGSSIAIQGDIELSGTYEGDIVMDLTVNGTQVSGSMAVDGTAIDMGTLSGGAVTDGDVSGGGVSGGDGGTSGPCSSAAANTACVDDGAGTHTLNILGAPFAGQGSAAGRFTIAFQEGNEASFTSGKRQLVLTYPVDQAAGTVDCGAGLEVTYTDEAGVGGSAVRQLESLGASCSATLTSAGTASGSLIQGTFTAGIYLLSGRTIRNVSGAFQATVP